MKTAVKGNSGEAMVLAALVDRGFDVLVPFGSGHPYDLVLTIDHRWFLRVQCKTAWAHAGCLIFNSRSTDHGRGPRSYLGLADIFGVYLPLTNAVYLVPIGAIAETKGRLRLEPAKNNQVRRVRFASDFELQRWTPESLISLVESLESASREPFASVA